MKFFETLLSGLKAIILSHSYSKADSDAKYLTKDKQAQPDWNESNKKSPAYIKNKPDIKGAFAQLSGELYDVIDEKTETPVFYVDSGNPCHSLGQQKDMILITGGRKYYTFGGMQYFYDSITRSYSYTGIALSFQDNKPILYKITVYTSILGWSNGVKVHPIDDITLSAVKENSIDEYIIALNNDNQLTMTRASNPDDTVIFATMDYVEEATKDLTTYLTKEEFVVPIKDSVTGKQYYLTMRNGQLVSQGMVTSIEITKLPDKLDYVEGEVIVPDGMVVVATYEDGTTEELPLAQWVNNVPITGVTVILTYEQSNHSVSTTFNVNIIPMEDALIDFEYTVNADGTYTITAWKGTLNGEPSTEMVVPNSSLIYI